MKFPPWDPPEPTDDQLLRFMHADTRQLYETGQMTRAQRQQLRDGIVAEYKAAQQSRSDNSISTSYDTYTIHKQIGQGANGFVYKATNSSGSEFAVKLLDPRTATEEKRKRFKNELGFCERNKHKNIVTVVDRGLFEDAPFYVMQCYEGSLRDLMRSRIEHQKILPIFSQILDGVEAAHLQNVIHRDLKPENILFAHATETPVVADFGIAHFEEENLITAVETNDGRRLANFEYAAPEQCKRGQHVDHRADIYALGLILNEMFTGGLARGTKYRTIASVAPQYGYLDEIIAQMLSNDPADRQQTVGAVKEQLRAREQAYFQDQKLSELKKTVIRISDLDDPLVLEPPKLVRFEWGPRVLTLFLSKPVSREWIHAFRQIGRSTTTLSHHSFEFHKDEVVVEAAEGDVPRTVEFFKEALDQAIKKYEELKRAEQQRIERERREQLRAEIELAEARARLREKIKL
jgi:serine/threonine protein kinase